MIQLGGFHCGILASLGNTGKELAKKAITIPFATHKLLGLVSNIASNATSNPINKFERRISGKGGVRKGKGLTLFFSNKDIYIIKNHKITRRFRCIN